MSDIVWRSAWLNGSEHCSLATIDAGHLFHGMVVAVFDGRPGSVRYRVEVDGSWRTRNVRVDLRLDGEDRMLDLSADGEGAWTVDGHPADQLRGCLDVDLGCSPSTNTLPIRRLGLEVGESEEIVAAWVRFPDLTVEPLRQTYQRSEERSWRYSSGDFVAGLTVNEEGLVLEYRTPELTPWTAIA